MELDYDSLTDEDKKIVDKSLQEGHILDAEDVQTSVLLEAIGSAETALTLPLSDFRQHVIPHIVSTRDLELLNEIGKLAKAEKKRGHIQLLLGARRQIKLLKGKDPFIQDLGVDSRWAQLEAVQDVQTQVM